LPVFLKPMYRPGQRIELVQRRDGLAAIATYGASTTLPTTITVPVSAPAIACRGWAAEKSKFLRVFLYCVNQKGAQKRGELKRSYLYRDTI
jgi:hypothetical protein